jgi:hypothetical protein
MSIEGGPFQCSITGETIDRKDIAAWNKHCQGHEGYHTMSGTTVCQECKRELRFRKHPYIPLVPETGHLKREVQLYCSEHDGDNMNPKNVEVENIEGETVTHKDTQKT